MKKQTKQHIVILGCGNVAWHLAKQFQSLKKYRLSIYNHQANPALHDFEKKLKCKTYSTFTDIDQHADYYAICVADRSIKEVAAQITIKNPNALLFHCSGSAKLEELGNRVHSSGVFYPLQTFSKGDEVDWKGIPVLIEASSKEAGSKLHELADQISRTVISIDYRERLKLHLAAVMVNNFTNAMYVSALELINQDSNKQVLNFNLLLPLIQQSVLKIGKMDPRVAQTGPAKRKDETVLKKHLQLLKDNNELAKLYKQLSKLIVKQQKRYHA